MEIATTVQAQLGRKALFMLGAKELTAIENGLLFKIGRNSKSVSHIEIVLEPSDTYRVRFLRFRAGNVKVLSEHEDI